MVSRARVGAIIKKAVWEKDMARLPPWHAHLLRLVRASFVLARDLAEGELTLRATSLVYTTLLSLVPLLAVSFSMLKAFGVHNRIEPVLQRFLEPLGTKGVEITAQIIGFVEHMKVGVLGTLGLGMLIYTVISLLQKVERAFNYTWHVQRARPFLQSFNQYLSVLIVGPLLTFTAIGLTATLTSHGYIQEIIAAAPLGGLLAALTRLVPYLLVIPAFTFVYIFVPNTKVRIASAFYGGTIAGVLWQLSGWAFTTFVVSSTRYTAIYSGFAIVIMFMIWLYVSWLILLIGASISYYHQHPEHLSVRRRDTQLSNRVKERLAMLLVALIGQRYYHKESAWSVPQLARHLQVPEDAVTSVVEGLVQAGILARSDDEPPRLLPARPMEITPVKDLLVAVRRAEELHHLHSAQLPAAPVVDDVVGKLERSATATLDGLTLKDLLPAHRPTDIPDPDRSANTSRASGPHARGPAPARPG
jgi:membrane protein